jgi:hypothetical protein
MVMVLYDPHRRWAHRGICRWEDRALFFAEGGMPNRRPAENVQKLWDQAKEICAMCPVLAECQRDTLGEEYGVYGGRDPYERWRIRKVMNRSIVRWPEERRLAWAKEIYFLRKELGMGWRAIQTRTGMPESAAQTLYALWKDRLAEEKEKAAKADIIDLDLPEPEAAKPDFPERPGRRHAWVRNNGLIADGWYRGETPDGQWINLTVFSGRGQVHKWFRKDDVHLYRPQAVVILNYAERPDDHDLTA